MKNINHNMPKKRNWGRGGGALQLIRYKTLDCNRDFRTMDIPFISLKQAVNYIHVCHDIDIV